MRMGECATCPGCVVSCVVLLFVCCARDPALEGECGERNCVGMRSERNAQCRRNLFPRKKRGLTKASTIIRTYRA